MALTRPAELRQCRVRLAREPAAAAAARGHVRAVIGDWKIPVDPDIAVLLTSDLVTNAIMTGTGEMVTLAVRCSSGRLRIDVYDGSRALPTGSEPATPPPGPAWRWSRRCRPRGAASTPRRARPCTSRSRSRPFVPTRKDTNQQRGNVRSIALRSPQLRPSSGSYWIKSSLSYANGNCVEVASLPDGEIGVRNSRDSTGPVLRFTSDEWHAFIGGVRNGEFDGFGA